MNPRQRFKDIESKVKGNASYAEKFQFAAHDKVELIGQTAALLICIKERCADAAWLLSYAQSLEAEVKALREGCAEIDYETYPGEPTDLLLKRTLAKADAIASERGKL